MDYKIAVHEVKDNDRIKGYADVVFNDSFKVSGIAIMKRSGIEELFVAMPRYKSAADDSGYRDICNPVTRQFREELYGNILTAYDNRINNDSPYYTV